MSRGSEMRTTVGTAGRWSTHERSEMLANVSAYLMFVVA